MKDLRLENLTLAKDGLIILESGSALKMSGEQEKQLLPTKRQQTSSQTPLRKSLRDKSVWLNRFLNQTQVAYSGGKVAQRTFISKEEKGALGSEAGKDRLTPLLASQAGLRSGRPSSTKLLSPEPGRGHERQLPVFGMYEKAETQKTSALFLHRFHCCFVPEVRKHLAREGLPF